MHSLIQSTPAYELSADITTTIHGHSFKLVSFVPTARHPEEQTKFQTVLTTAELEALRDFFDLALEEAGKMAS